MTLPAPVLRPAPRQRLLACALSLCLGLPGAAGQDAGGADFPLPRAKFLELFGGDSLLFAARFESGDTSGWTVTPERRWYAVPDSGNHAYQFNFEWHRNETGLALAGDPAWTDYTVGADVKITTINPWSEARLFGRYVDADNHYCLALVEESGPDRRRLRLKRRLNGVLTHLVSTEWLAFEPGVWHRLELEFRGSQIRAWLDDTLVLETTDASLNAGRIGLGGYKQDLRFDNVLVSR